MKTSAEKNSHPKSGNLKKKNQRIVPSKPGSDPDQTPERETNQPPVAKSNKGSSAGKKSNKIGF